MNFSKTIGVASNHASGGYNNGVSSSGGSNMIGGSAANNNDAVASQFETWAREQNTFTQISTKADRDRVRLEEKIAQLRTEQKHLSVQLRDCQDKLGRSNRERSLLVQQKDTLERTRMEERDMLQQFVTKLNELISTDMKHKQTFCHDMNELNHELSNLLLQQELLRLQKLISVETVQILVDHFQKQSLCAASPDSCDTIPVSGSFMDDLQASVQELQKSQSIFNETLNERNQLLETISRHRTQMMEQQKSTSENGESVLTLDSILRMEQAWQEENIDSSLEDSASGKKMFGIADYMGYNNSNTQVSDSVHMQLFYETASDRMSQQDDTPMNECSSHD